LRQLAGSRSRLGSGAGIDKKDKLILESIQAFFGGIGNIHEHKTGMLTYQVTSLKDLAVIIEQFSNYPLLSYKAIDFNLFKQAYYLISAKEHLKYEGFLKLLSFKAGLNKGILDAELPHVEVAEFADLPEKFQLNPQWLAGFISAEGCFFISLTKSSSAFGHKISLKLIVNLLDRDTVLLKNIMGYLGCGNLHQSKTRDVASLTIGRLSDILEKVIPLFDRYQIEGIKKLDYKD
jgi:hypothetical protein